MPWASWSAGCARVIVTTNLDPMVETALRSAGSRSAGRGGVASLAGTMPSDSGACIPRDSTPCAEGPWDQQSNASWLVSSHLGAVHDWPGR
jgi:hypothetical protein